MSFKNTILTGPAGVFKHGSIEEAKVSATTASTYPVVKPGLFVEVFDGETALSDTSLNGSQGNARKIILEGGIHVGEDVETIYQEGDMVRVATLRSGETFNARVESGLAITKGKYYTALDTSGYVTEVVLGSTPVNGTIIALETSAAGSDRLVAFKAL